MTGILFLEQLLNGLGFGLMLFLLAAGLTLVFGIMDVLNLAHGSLFMSGAYVAAHELGVEGPVRETYLETSTTGSPDVVTEVGWPIFRATR